MTRGVGLTAAVISTCTMYFEKHFTWSDGFYRKGYLLLSPKLKYNKRRHRGNASQGMLFCVNIRPDY